MAVACGFKSLLCIFFIYICFADGISVEEDLSLTLAEKRALDKFKVRMIPKMPHDYMKTDIYLIRWLRARKLNQQEAERMLMTNLRWRKDNKVDTISQEDWSDIAEEYNYTINTHDKRGRPIGAVNLGPWNVRKAVITGKMERLIKFGLRTIEEAFQQVIELQRQGKSVTQFKVLFNIEGFNFIDHVCPRCIRGYALFITTYEEYYPGYLDELVLINVPPTFAVILDALRPFIGEETRKKMKVFGQDKRTWGKYLDKEISRDQRTLEFGGNKADR